MNERPATVLHADDREFLEELSDFLEILGNSTRLRILKILGKKSLDARSISIEIETSYENTKKHLEKLLNAGLITRRPGLGRETSKGVHPAWEYSQVPGALEGIQRDLGVFSAIHPMATGMDLDERIAEVRARVSGELEGVSRWLVVMVGEWDGHTLPVGEDCLALGRAEEGGPEIVRGCRAFPFPESYRSVTRITRPHALMTQRDGRCFIEDGGSTGGTYVNGERLDTKRRHLLKDGDTIDLSLGSFGAKLLFIDSPHGAEGTDG